MEHSTWEKAVSSLFLAFLTSFANDYGILSLLVFFSIILDIITGILKAKALRNIQSSVGYMGLWKKASLLAAFVFGFLLDSIETYLLELGLHDLRLNIDFAIPFGRIIGIYIILNECISIIENLNTAGVKLPQFIVRALKSKTDIIDENRKEN